MPTVIDLMSLGKQAPVVTLPLQRILAEKIAANYYVNYKDFSVDNRNHDDGWKPPDTLSLLQEACEDGCNLNQLPDGPRELAMSYFNNEDPIIKFRVSRYMSCDFDYTINGKINRVNVRFGDKCISVDYKRMELYIPPNV